MELGNYRTTGIEAEITRESDGWIEAKVTVDVEMTDYRSTTATVTVQCGCYADGSSTDHDSWSEDQEGARAIAALIGGGDVQRIIHFFPDDSRDLGSFICSAIVAAAAA